MFERLWQLKYQLFPHNFCISALFCDNEWRDSNSIFDNQIAFYSVVLIQKIFWLFRFTAMLKLISDYLLQCWKRPCLFFLVVQCQATRGRRSKDSREKQYFAFLSLWVSLSAERIVVGRFILFLSYLPFN